MGRIRSKTESTYPEILCLLIRIRFTEDPQHRRGDGGVHDEKTLHGSEAAAKLL